MPKPAGLVTVSEVLEIDVGVTGVPPPNDTVLSLAKSLPEMTTWVPPPAGPDTGEMPGDRRRRVSERGQQSSSAAAPASIATVIRPRRRLRSIRRSGVSDPEHTA